jgi:hypothetical protein
LRHDSRFIKLACVADVTTDLIAIGTYEIDPCARGVPARDYAGTDD